MHPVLLFVLFPLLLAATVWLRGRMEKEAGQWKLKSYKDLLNNSSVNTPFVTSVASTISTSHIFDTLVENNVAPKVAEALTVTSSPDKDAKSEFKKRLGEIFAGVESKTAAWHDIPLALKHRKTLPIIFLGTNGVGKSTTVAKVATWLKTKYPTLKISLIAADTFRGGAIEQLKIHGGKLGLQVFARDYGHDPSAVVREGMYKAEARGDDIVLIDSAGRFVSGGTDGKSAVEMCKMVKYADPYRIVFVAECLTGTSLAEQIGAFNEAIHHHCSVGIDGIILTKADAAGEKLGTFINITALCKLPIDFIGTGQLYQDLEEGTHVSSALLNSL